MAKIANSSSCALQFAVEDVKKVWEGFAGKNARRIHCSFAVSKNQKLSKRFCGLGSGRGYHSWKRDFGRVIDGGKGGLGSVAVRIRERKGDRCRGGLSLYGQGEEEILGDITQLSESLLNLKDLVSVGYRGIGPDMRERVERLQGRVSALKLSADRTISSGSRIPAQINANLRVFF